MKLFMYMLIVLGFSFSALAAGNMPTDGRDCGGLNGSAYHKNTNPGGDILTGNDKDQNR